MKKNKLIILCCITAVICIAIVSDIWSNFSVHIYRDHPFYFWTAVGVSIIGTAIWFFFDFLKEVITTVGKDKEDVIDSIEESLPENETTSTSVQEILAQQVNKQYKLVIYGAIVVFMISFLLWWVIPWTPVLQVLSDYGGYIMLLIALCMWFYVARSKNGSKDKNVTTWRTAAFVTVVVATVIFSAKLRQYENDPTYRLIVHLDEKERKAIIDSVEAQHRYTAPRSAFGRDTILEKKFDSLEIVKFQQDRALEIAQKDQIVIRDTVVLAVKDPPKAPVARVEETVTVGETPKEESVQLPKENKKKNKKGKKHNARVPIQNKERMWNIALQNTKCRKN